MVPSELKAQVWTTWRAFTKARRLQDRIAARKPYFDARKAAIDFVLQQESVLCD